MHRAARGALRRWCTNARAPPPAVCWNLLHANASNRDAASTAGAAPVLAKLLTDPEIEDGRARSTPRLYSNPWPRRIQRGVLGGVKVRRGPRSHRPRSRPTTYETRVDTMRRSTSQKTLAAMMRRLTPKSWPSKRAVRDIPVTAARRQVLVLIDAQRLEREQRRRPSRPSSTNIERPRWRRIHLLEGDASPGNAVRPPPAARAGRAPDQQRRSPAAGGRP